MTRFVGTPLRGIEFSSPSDEAVSARVNGDGHPRIRIDAGGRITWSAGSSAGDTNLYRDGENTLTTDDVFKASGGLVTLSTDGAPTVALPNGALAIDTTNNKFYFRSDNVWNQVTGGGGGASVEIGDTPPLDPNAGDIWFESDTGSSFVYYDSSWIEVGGASAGGATSLDGLGDVTLGFLEASQVLTFNGLYWTNDQLTLGTDTKGDYVVDVTAGTGVTVVHTPSEGSSPTISIGQSVETTDSPTFAGALLGNVTIALSGPNDVSTFSGDLTISSQGGTTTLSDNVVISGDLTVNGTTTTLNTETLAVEDNIVVLNSGITGSPTLNAGIEVERGTSTNVQIRWNETSDKWELTNNGTSYDVIQTATPVANLEQKVRNQMIYLMCEVGQ